MYLRLRAHESGPVDYTATSAATDDPWFAGTGFKPGDKVLDVVGNEWDALPDSPPPAECVKPGLTVLFHYEGQPSNADAVRYTAPSGARVFAGGAQQLSWPLDTFNLGRFGRTLPPDTRFQRFMRNALDDLRRPAPPVAVKLTVRRRTVTVRVVTHDDARVHAVAIVRHAGAAPFAPTDDGVVKVCRAARGVCRQRRLRPGTYRYAAVTVDEWGTSVATLSRSVVVRRARHRP
jgi:hypothetical protein